MAYSMKKQVKTYERSHKRHRTWQKAVGVLACVVVFCTTYMLILPAITKTEQSDPTADVETAQAWEATFADVELSGNWAADLLQIAQTQLGYTESTKNFVYVAGDSADGYGTSDGLPADEETEGTAAVDAIETEALTDTAEQPEETGDADTDETETPTETTTQPTEDETVSSGDAQETEDVTEEGTEAASKEPESTEDAETEAEGSPAYTELYAELSALYDEAQTYAAQAGDDMDALVSLCVDACNTAENDAEYAAALYAEGNLTQEEYDTLAALASDIKTYVEDLLDSYGLVKKGYTRYGAWYGLPYEDWCAMFVSFCLNYAEVPVDAFPQDASCTGWIEALSGPDYGLYIENTANDPEYEGESYVPAPGDLVFFDFDGDGAADHVGIAAALSEDPAGSLDEAERLALVDAAIEGLVAPVSTTITTEEDGGTPEYNYTTLVTIEGNSSDKVQTVAYSLDDESILGYAALPENLFTLTFEGEDYTVTVTYGPEAELPEDVELTASEYGKDDGTYLARYEEAAELYGWADGSASVNFRLFDISLYADGREAEPAAPVQVTIAYSEENRAKDYIVTHYGDEETGTAAQDVEAESVYEDGVQTVDFSLDSFSDVSTASSSNVLEIDYNELTSFTKGFVIGVGETVTVRIYNSPFSSSSYTQSATVKPSGSNNSTTITNYSYTGTYTSYTYTVGTDYDTLVITGIAETGSSYDTYTLTATSGQGNRATTVGELVLKVYVGDVSNIFTAYQYYHMDVKVDASFVINYYDSDGKLTTITPTNVSVTGVSATIYNTATINGNTNSGTTWADLDTSYTEENKSSATEGSYYWTEYEGNTVQAVDVNFSDPSEDAQTGDYEIASIAGHGVNGQAPTSTLQYYDGDTIELTVSISYEIDGTTYTTTYTATYTVAEIFNVCSSATSTGDMRGFDIEIDIADITEIAASRIYKVDQYGNSVPGATFAFYATNEAYEYLTDSGDYIDLSDYDYTVDSSTGVITAGSYTITPKIVGTTDSSGVFSFTTDEGYDMTIAMLEDAIGSGYFIMREISVPDGYRLIADEAELYIENNVLLCNNSYESGVWSAASAMITASSTLVSTDGETSYTYYTTGDDGIETTGTLYAVVLAKSGDTWYAVSGDSLTGYTLTDATDIADFISSNPDSVYTFDVSASGYFVSASVTDIPGDVRTYYTYLAQQGYSTDSAEYRIAYYYMDENGNLDEIDGEASGFSVQWAASIEVSNLVNRLYAQKLNEDDELVNGAVFALYAVSETEDGTVYYTASNGTLVCLYPDDGDSGTDNGVAGDNTGVAYVQGSSGTTGTYTVDEATGVITVTIGGSTYTINPVDAETTTEAASNGSGEDGTAVFSGLSSGYYYLREIYAPDGYDLNTTEVMVAVSDDTIMANAGTADDGVTVGRGPGYLVNTLSQFASEGQIDNTLTWIYGVLKVTGKSTSFADASTYSSSTDDWGYITENYWDGTSELLAGSTDISTTANTSAATTYLTYNPDSDSTLFNYTVNTARASTASNAAYNASGNYARRLYTEVGWSYLGLYQDDEYGVTAAAANGADYTLLDSLVDGDGDGTVDGLISSLLSRSVYVQVTDEQVTDLEISKTVVDTEENLTGDEEFTFTVNLYSGYTEDETTGERTYTALTGSYAYTIYDVAEDGTRTVATDDDGNELTGTVSNGDEITLKADQVIVIEGLPYGAWYTVTEANPGDYTTTVEVGGYPEDETTYYTVSGRTVTGQLVWEDEDNRTVSLAYVNTYVNPVELVILKTDADGGTSLADAQFVLYYTEDGVNYYSYDETDGVTWTALGENETESDYALTSDENGKIEIHKLTPGTYYLKEIAAPVGYNLLTNTITITVSASNATATGGNSSTGYTVENTTAEGDAYTTYTVTVPNSTGASLPNTGGAGTAMLYTFALLLIFGAGAGLLGRKRRGERYRR